MKKLLAIIVLGLLWSNVGFAKCIQGDCKNGQGIWQYPKAKYIGGFKNGLAHGQVTIEFSDGEHIKYVGEFKDGKPYGSATVTYVDGRKYVGELNQYTELHGQGTMTYADGKKYVGEFKNGKRDGKMTATYADGSKYVGEFKNDKKNGVGTKTYTDGGKYSGDWKDGKRHGYGTEILPGPEKGEFNQYVGEFKNGKRDGNGTVTNKAYPKFKMVGEFKNGLAHGKGKITFPDGRKSSGEFKKGDLYNGEATGEDGTKYIVKRGKWITKK